MKIGIEFKIDVTKIEKARLYQGQKGTYLTISSFVDLGVQDQYGNNGMVTHKKEQNEERAPILGNAKVFWTDAPNQRQQAPQQISQQEEQQKYQQQAQQQAAQGMDDFDDIPF